ncbi:MAG: DEAD/DEAH box helicase family protein [Victivallales bacterium]|nr:DEAD/DEAH box helicase family protein [Victivallales bacterium]
MKINLRPCQQEAVEAVYEHLRTKDTNSCAVLPRGYGKSLCLVKNASDAVTLWGGRIFRTSVAHAKHVAEAITRHAGKECAVVTGEKTAS